MRNRHTTLVLLIAVILAIFVGRTLLVKGYDAPLLSDIFVGLTALGALGVCATGFRHLQRGDWLAALALAVLVGVGMRFATLFSPYPFFGLVRDRAGHALVRGALTFIRTGHFLQQVARSKSSRYNWRN